MSPHYAMKLAKKAREEASMRGVKTSGYETRPVAGAFTKKEPESPVVPTGNLLGLNNSNSTKHSNSEEFDYAVVDEKDLEMFVYIVEDMVSSQGWELHGGLVVDNGKFYQAFVKHNAPSRNKELSEIFTGGRRSATRKNRRRVN